MSAIVRDRDNNRNLEERKAEEERQANNMLTDNTEQLDSNESNDGDEESARLQKAKDNKGDYKQLNQNQSYRSDV